MKNQGPRRGQFKQGIFRPSAPDKYVGDANNIIWRSSWELKFMQFLDRSPTVMKWSSEEYSIPYFSPLDKRVHQYYIDFTVVLVDEDGVPHPWLIEVKPLSHIKKPEAPKRMTDKATKNYLYAAKQYIINSAKFEAAKEFCAQRGARFGIVTENFIFKGI